MKKSKNKLPSSPSSQFPSLLRCRSSLQACRPGHPPPPCSRSCPDTSQGTWLGSTSAACHQSRTQLLSSVLKGLVHYVKLNIKHDKGFTILRIFCFNFLSQILDILAVCFSVLCVISCKTKIGISFLKITFCSIIQA